jgi:hypothetical protein
MNAAQTQPDTVFGAIFGSVAHAPATTQVPFQKNGSFVGVVFSTHLDVADKKTTSFQDWVRCALASINDCGVWKS